MSGLNQWVRQTLLAPWVSVKGSSRQPAIALTFDDGPHPEVTPAVLDVLARHGVQASFFCVGERLAAQPALAARLRHEGHEIANHSMSHAEFAHIGGPAIAAELDQAFGLRDEAGRPWMVPHLLRPPKGVLNGKVLQYCITRGIRVVHWSRDPEDYAAHNAASVLQHFDARPLAAGDIVLLHDKMPHSAATTDALIRQAQASGLRCVTVSALLGLKPAPPAA